MITIGVFFVFDFSYMTADGDQRSSSDTDPFFAIAWDRGLVRCVDRAQSIHRFPLDLAIAKRASIQTTDK